MVASRQTLHLLRWRVISVVRVGVAVVDDAVSRHAADLVGDVQIGFDVFVDLHIAGERGHWRINGHVGNWDRYVKGWHALPLLIKE